MARVKICPACGCLNPETIILCKYCRTDISAESVCDEADIEIVSIKKECPNCQTLNEVDAVVCSKCDQPLDEVEPIKFKGEIEQVALQPKLGEKVKISTKEPSEATINEFVAQAKHVLILVSQECDTLKIQQGRKVILGREGNIKPELFIPYFTVSRKHLIVEFNNDHWFITDNESTNGTYLNGEMIKKGKQYAVKRGDIISLSTKFKLRVG